MSKLNFNSSLKSNFKSGFKLNLSVSLMLLGSALAGSIGAEAQTLTLYTDRPTARLAPSVQKFTQLTGAQVTVVELPYAKLLAQYEAEGQGSPADLIYIKDMVMAGELVNKGHLQAMPARTAVQAAQTVPAALRDSSSLWTALQYRARTIMYEPSRVKAGELSTYEDLADAKWAGRLCLRTSKHNYNEALVSSLIERHGESRTREILKGWVDNLAVAPINGDTALLEAIANGVCDVGLSNTYYLAQLIAKNPSFTVRPFFADQAGAGVHVNGEMIGVASSSKQVDLAGRFIELLLDDEYQIHASNDHFTYPAKESLSPLTLVKDWGRFLMDLTPWSKLSEPSRVQRARDLMNEVGYQ